jgi:ribonuclease P protein component
MLKKRNRITSKKEFQNIKKNGVLKQYPFFALIELKSPLSEEGEAQDIKFGFVISRKISKKAVFRNKIKRKLSEEVRKNLDKFENGFRGIFLVKKNILDEKNNIKDFKIV